MHKSRQSERALMLAVMLGLGSGCKRASGPAAAGQGERKLRELAPLSLQMALPDAASVTPVADGVRIELNARSRTPRTVIIARQSGVSTRTGAHVPKTRPGLRIQYELKLIEGAGSGGDEQHLDGTAEVDGHGFRISCFDQAEAPARPDAQWCLPWLVTLKR